MDINRYDYGLNDPINFSDPKRHAVLKDVDPKTPGVQLFSVGGAGFASSPQAAQALYQRRENGYAYVYSNIFGSRTVIKNADGSQTLIWKGPAGSAGYGDAVKNASCVNDGGGLCSNNSNNANNPGGTYLGSVGPVYVGGEWRTIVTNCQSCFAQKAVLSFNGSPIPLYYLKKDQTANQLLHREDIIDDCNCKAFVRRVFPGQWLKSMLEEIKEAADAGDATPKTAWKLLTDRKFKR